MTNEEIIKKCISLKNGLYVKEKGFAKTFPNEYEKINSLEFPDDFTFQQKLYHYLHNDMNFLLGICTVCGKRCTFLGFRRGYSKSCSLICSNKSDSKLKKMRETNIKNYGVPCVFQSNIIKEQSKKTSIEKYGCEYPMQSNIIKQKTIQTNQKKYGCDYYLQTNEKKIKSKKTCVEKYGVEYPTQSKEVQDKTKQTNIEKYGCEFVLQSEQVKEKSKKTCNEKYGTNTASQADCVKEKIKNTNIERYGNGCAMGSEHGRKKSKETLMKKYGVSHNSQLESVKQSKIESSIKKYGVQHVTQSKEIKEKTRQTNLEKYGVEWTCMRFEARKYSNNSKPNIKFASILDQENIEYIKEFPLHKYSFDFKVNDILIEINPTITHNSYISIYDVDPKEPNYHYLKSKMAEKNGYFCIHVWDWDAVDKIVSLLKPKQILYARNLELKEVSNDEADLFLNTYHLQNTCKGQTIRYGLYCDNVLVQLMTFGKPRYNKKYEWELLRLCSHDNYIITGGAEKIFKYILEKFNPKSIISYCDNSKFNGFVYKRLNFELLNNGSPSKHWYNINKKHHITDNFLRQHGFDQLFGTNYGKGTSNEELMIKYGYFPVYDCGQSTFIYLN